MPRLNGTGPQGMGARTGWGLGPCGAGMGYGRRGAGRGRRLGWKKFSSSEEAAVLEEELKSIKARLAELKGQK